MVALTLSGLSLPFPFQDLSAARIFLSLFLSDSLLWPATSSHICLRNLLLHLQHSVLHTVVVQMAGCPPQRASNARGSVLADAD